METNNLSKYNVSYMRTAIQWSSESTCNRMKVAAVLVVNDRVRAINYNGTVTGDDNCCEKEFFVCDVCKEEFEKQEDIAVHLISTRCRNYLLGNVGFTKEVHGDDDAIVHAEINLIADCAAEGISTKNGDLYITVAPCINCANTIIQAKIKRVLYMSEYNNTKGVDKLRRLGVEVIKLNEKDILC